MIRITCIAACILTQLSACATVPSTKDMARDFEPTITKAAADAGQAGGAAFAREFAEAIQPHFDKLEFEIADLTAEVLEGSKPSVITLGESLGTSFGTTVTKQLASEIPVITNNVAQDFADALDERVEAVSKEIGRSADEKFDAWLTKYFEHLRTARTEEQEQNQRNRDEERKDTELATIRGSITEIATKLNEFEGDLRRQPDQFMTIIGAIIGAVAATGAVLALVNRRETHATSADQLRAAVLEIKGVVSSQKDKVADIEDFIRSSHRSAKQDAAS